MRQDESAVAWFYRLLRNALIDHQRGESAEQRGLAALSRETAAGESAEPDQEMLDTICACVTSLVETLKPEYAAAIERVDLASEPLQSYASDGGHHAGQRRRPPVPRPPGAPPAGRCRPAAPARPTAVTSASAAPNLTRTAP